MTPAQHQSAAAALLQAEATGQQTGLLSIAYPDITMDDAYAIQKQVVAGKLARGEDVIGWKIGLTSRAMQQALNIDIPDSGVLTSRRGRDCLCHESAPWRSGGDARRCAGGNRLCGAGA